MGVKSHVVAEIVVPIVATAAGATLPAWNLDDVAKLLLALAKPKGSTESPAVASFHGRVAEALFPKLPTMSDVQLIKVALAFGRSPDCKEFLEAVVAEVVGRNISSMPPAQLMLLTQAALPVGGEHASLRKLLDCWATACGMKEGNNGAFSCDQFAKLAQVLAPVGASHAELWEKLGARLLAEKGSLTDVGKQAVLAAFQDGAGPSFVGKEDLLPAAKPQKPKERREDAKRRDSRSRNDRGRGGGDRRSRERRGSRERGRSRSRDRRRR